MESGGLCITMPALQFFKKKKKYKYPEQAANYGVTDGQQKH